MPEAPEEKSLTCDVCRKEFPVPGLRLKVDLYGPKSSVVVMFCLCSPPCAVRERLGRLVLAALADGVAQWERP